MLFSILLVKSFPVSSYVPPKLKKKTNLAPFDVDVFLFHCPIFTLFPQHIHNLIIEV